MSILVAFQVETTVRPTCNPLRDKVITTPHEGDEFLPIFAGLDSKQQTNRPVFPIESANVDLFYSRRNHGTGHNYNDSTERKERDASYRRRKSYAGFGAAR